MLKNDDGNTEVTSTQIFGPGCGPDFCHRLLVAMLWKCAILAKGNDVYMISFFWHYLWRDNVEKICEFQDEKIRSHGSNFLASPLGGDVEEITESATSA